jgi:hypothetical protein
MNNLLECTFIIPIKVEHPDRYRNAKTTLSFINHHFKTNVFIYEISESGETKLDFLKDLPNLNIKHWIDKGDQIFHRTKYLNIMLDEVKTPVVSNYDIDVILDPDLYLECQSDIMEGHSDVIYPYHYGYDFYGQKMIFPNIDLDEFRASRYDTSYITERTNIFGNYYCEYGHCIFYRTSTYKECGGENESFISYGPEDKERGERFIKLGKRVSWKKLRAIYHFEHFRGDDSSKGNSHYKNNCDVYDFISKLSNESLREYYTTQDYIKKYKTIGNENSNNRG